MAVSLRQLLHFLLPNSSSSLPLIKVYAYIFLQYCSYFANLKDFAFALRSWSNSWVARMMSMGCITQLQSKPKKLFFGPFAVSAETALYFFTLCKTYLWPPILIFGCFVSGPDLLRYTSSHRKIENITFYEFCATWCIV